MSARIPSCIAVGLALIALPPPERLGSAARQAEGNQQIAMSRRARARIKKLEAGHLSPISRPRAVARVIARAVRATTD